MRIRLVFSLSLAAFFTTVYGPAETFSIGKHKFTVADGFEIQQVTDPSLVHRPIEGDFDDQGRLYVTDSAGVSYDVHQQLEKRPHRVVCLEDLNRDGIFDRSTVFADHMMFPEGAMWYHGSLYVAAPPSIWKLTDTDGDLVADQREEWFQGKTLTGCANDLHGPYLGLDGWIYWCKGAFAEQTYRLPNGKPFTTRAAHIFRARPDGTGIEPVMTGGMDNPVEVAFMPTGERILTTTFFQHPGGGQRDGLIHAIYGGVYGKRHDVIDDHPQTGDLMPVLVQLGPAAPCGLARYQSDTFGPDYTDAVFSTTFNLHKVIHHRLKPKGATYQAENTDFVVSSNPDFHPTDVLEDADGSLLVIDTGGWYKVCCPTSQLAKPDVLGAIYRVRKIHANPPADPQGRAIGWNEPPWTYARLLGDRRPWVRKRARHRLLAGAPEKSIDALRQVLEESASATARLEAVWTLCQIPDPKARTALRTAFRDASETVQHAAIQAVAVWRDPKALPELRHLLATSASWQLKRSIAEALGRIGASDAVGDLLRAAGKKTDRVLEHSLTYALIEIDDPKATAQGLASGSPLTRKTALIALDQMAGGTLQPGAVVSLLSQPEIVLRTAANWIVLHHPEWAATLTVYFQQRLSTPHLDEDALSGLETMLARFAREKPTQALLARIVRDPRMNSRNRLVGLRVMARTAVKPVPKSWLDALEQALTVPAPSLVDQAIETVRSLPLKHGTSPPLERRLRALAEDPQAPPEQRLAALAAIPERIEGLNRSQFSLVLSHLSSDTPVLKRQSAARILSRSVLSERQLLRVAKALEHAGPFEIKPLLTGLTQSKDSSIGLATAQALQHAPGLSSLQEPFLDQLFERYPDDVQTAATQVKASLRTSNSEKRAHLLALAKQLQGGDVRRGQAVFNGPKAACSSCHEIGYLGGHVGPDLTRIGRVRTELDLLESIVYPSTTFVRSYEPMILSTRDGEEYNGILKKKNRDEVVLVTGPNNEMRFAPADIVEIRPSRVSLMPEGLDQVLTPRELADLIAFLKATKW